MAIDTYQIHIGAELSIAIGPAPQTPAERREPDIGGLALGLFADVEFKAHTEDLGPFGGPFVHARFGRGWQGFTLGANGGYSIGFGDIGHLHNLALSGEAGLALTSGLKPSLHVGARANTLVALQLRASTQLLHDDVVTHNPTVGVGLVAPLVPGYGDFLLGGRTATR
jgi:hypothetical protein